MPGGQLTRHRLAALLDTLQKLRYRHVHSERLAGPSEGLTFPDDEYFNVRRELVRLMTVLSLVVHDKAHATWVDSELRRVS